MNQKTRLATRDDLEKIQAIFESGRGYLAAQGLPQWQNGYGPTGPDAALEIEADRGYVLLVGGVVSGYASLIPGPDGSPPLTEGEWDTSHSRYAALHRVALDRAVRGRGLAAVFMREIIQRARDLGYQDIRIDTHPENKIMQRVILKVGFTYRGIMHLPIPEGERFAYQLLID